MRTISRSETISYSSFLDLKVTGLSADCPEENHSLPVYIAVFNANHFPWSVLLYFLIFKKFHNEHIVSWSCWQHFSLSEKLSWYYFCNSLVVGLWWIISGFFYSVFLHGYSCFFNILPLILFPMPNRQPVWEGEGNVIMTELQITVFIVIIENFIKWVY